MTSDSEFGMGGLKQLGWRRRSSPKTSQEIKMRGVVPFKASGNPAQAWTWTGT